MSELYRYVSAELGGQHYRVIVLGSQDHPIYEGRLAVALPPKIAGRFIVRDDWDQAMSGRARGVAAATSTTQQHAQHAPTSAGNETMLTSLIKLLFEQQRSNSEATLTAVRDMTTNTHQLVRDVVQHRDNEVARGSLAEQLGEFAETSRVVQRLGRAFGAASDNGGDGAGGSSLQQAAETAFLTKVMGGMLEPRQNGAGPRTQVPGMIPTSRPIPVSPKK